VNCRSLGCWFRVTALAAVFLVAACGGPRAEAERDLVLFYEARVRGDWDGASGLMTPEGRAISDSLSVRGYAITGFRVRELVATADAGSARVSLTLEGAGTATAEERVDLVRRADRWRVARLRRGPLEAVGPFDIRIQSIGVAPAGCAEHVDIVVEVFVVGVVVDPPDLTVNLLRREGETWRVYRVAVVPRAVDAPGTHRVQVFRDLDLTRGDYRVVARLPVVKGEGDPLNNRAERNFRCVSEPRSGPVRP
jgi:hypothetical protein